MLKAYRWFCLTLLIAAMSPALFAQQRRVIPYYRFQFGEGIAIPSKGDFFASSVLGTQFGTLWRPSDRISLFGMYGLNYDGPGLVRSEGRLFAERAIKHSFMLEPGFELGSIGKLRTKVFNISEDRRSGTNELWGKGLYDYNTQGFSVGLEKEFFGLKFYPNVRWMDMGFPNYTDLLREFEQGGLTAEIAGGQIDQTATAFGFNINKYPYIFELAYSIQDFDRERVLTKSGTYTDDLQKDTSLDLSASGEASLWRFVLIPRLAYRQKRSNQNYLNFAFFGDPNPTFIEKNYNYDEFSAGGQLHLKVTNAKSIFGSLDLNNRTYTDRPPRDGSGVYLTGQKQNTIWGGWGAGIQWQVSPYSTWSLSYNFIYSTSNMKHESFIPYNYTGHGIGLAFTVTP